ncbi:hypothetical protein [Mixta intestinalis]|uniref:Lipase n=1 Tax=Mixta intestinalis TaxID=1615494 RepID=A0A6P1Q3E5_9GAMM|nr:hypothetical protein [Mixta intestinalis]QHM72921.1 Lipase [Mixta intestinalis]
MGIFNHSNFNKDDIDDLMALTTFNWESYSSAIWEKSFQEYSGELGWKVITAEDINYSGKTGGYNQFYGENLLLATSEVSVLGKYDNDGKLTSIGLSYWGTGTAHDAEDWTSNFLMDMLTNVGVALSYQGSADGYIFAAFNDLLTKVSEFAQANGLSGKDIIVTGLSMGGMSVNSMASASSMGHWKGFYEDSVYVSLSSPTQNRLDDKVLNIGLENDPIFRVLDGDSISPDSFNVHDKPQESCTNNIVAFNDHYIKNDILSLLNLVAWQGGHNPKWYMNAINAISKSIYYDITDKNSTVITAQLSDKLRETTWVEDLNYKALPHEGPTFILGSDKADLIAGGKGMDYLEGFAGDDVFRDAGGFNVIDGGAGYDLFDLQGEISKTSIAKISNGILAIKGADGGITLLHDVEAIKETYWFLWDNYLTYEVTNEGLTLDGKLSLTYANSVHASTEQSGEIFAPENGGFYVDQTSWLVGSAQDTVMHGSRSSDVFVCQSGDDVIYTNGGDDTILLTGNDIGNKTVYGFGQDDKLAFMANTQTTANGSYLDYLSECENGVQFTCDAGSITLVGVTLDQLHESQFVLA